MNRPPESPSRYNTVIVGRVPGVYDTWEEAERQVNGFRGNEHARFDNKQDAVRYMRQKFANVPNIPMPTKASDQHSAESKGSDVEDFFGDGDGDSYGGDDSNNQRERAKGGRRDSVLLEKIEMESGPEPHKVLHVKNEPDLSDLSLRDIIPSNVIAFMTAANKKMRQTGFSIMLQKVIEQDVRNLLLIELGVDELKYYRLSNKEIVRGLSSLVRPNTMIEFHTLMVNNLKFKAVYDRNKFEEYYYKLLTYFEEYTLLFRLLSQDNTRNIPPLKDYSFGLIQVIKTHLDKTYFRETRACINNDDFNTIGEFITLFKEQATGHYNSFRNFRSIPSNKATREMFDRMNASKAPEPYKSKKYVSDKYGKRPVGNTKPYSGNKYHRYQKRDGSGDELNMVRDMNEESEASHSDTYYNKGISDNSDTESSKDMDTKRRISDVSNSDSDSNDSAHNASNKEYMHLCALAEKFNAKNVKAKRPQVCIYAAVYGQCFQEKELKHSREYSHDPTDVSGLHERIYRRMYESNAGRKPTDTFSPKPNTKALHNLKEDSTEKRKVLARGDPLPSRSATESSNSRRYSKPSKGNT
jgi:hypothetical protein